MRAQRRPWSRSDCRSVVSPAGAAARSGLAVPGTVAITGWDDTDAATPAGLTTVRQSLRDQGRRCARIALGHPRPDRQEPPAWEVVERTSTR